MVNRVAQCPCKTARSIVCQLDIMVIFSPWRYCEATRSWWFAFIWMRSLALVGNCCSQLWWGQVKTALSARRAWRFRCNLSAVSVEEECLQPEKEFQLVWHIFSCHRDSFSIDASCVPCYGTGILGIPPTNVWCAARWAVDSVKTMLTLDRYYQWFSPQHGSNENIWYISPQHQ